MNTPLDTDLRGTIQLFARYLMSARAKNLTMNADLAAEALERLNQMQFLLSMVLTIKDHIQSGRPLDFSDFAMPIETPAEASEAGTGHIIRHGFFLVRLYAESFYYIAFRFCKILTSQNKLTGQFALPRLEGFQSIGIRNVRNNLIEHPGGPASQVFCQNHSFGGHEGPQLKLQGGVVSFIDKGLFVNAAEFKTNLEVLLNRVLAQHLT